MRPATTTTPPERRCGLRHRLVVVAPDTEQVVRHAGGWLFDQVMAGWMVYALVAERGNGRPLRILGTFAAGLHRLDAALDAPGPQAVAVDAALYQEDAQVRALVGAARDRGRTEVRLWNAGGADHDPFEHRLSSAAKAFKAQALFAVGAGVRRVDGVEQFHRAAVSATVIPFPTHHRIAGPSKELP
ncbi:hypothetical protein [Nocardia sp. alder85J]|uniref:hypothetical protein n=1 Tax=Nocardia sp. alder85J TaxID=2862949 RepID=UPI001CD66D12|nr:hypothetical protein [Nocardia sp. alder85J]MCX4095474.1 hypothetical protein [Nocardia sp. alder85J]